MQVIAKWKIAKVRAAILAELKRQYNEPRAAWDGVTCFYDDEIYSGFIEGEPDWDAVANAAIVALDRKP